MAKKQQDQQFPDLPDNEQQAAKEGYLAFLEGVAHEANPYTLGGETLHQHEGWRCGWEYAFMDAEAGKL